MVIISVLLDLNFRNRLLMELKFWVYLQSVVSLFGTIIYWNLTGDWECEKSWKKSRLANRFAEIKFFFMEFVCESMQKFFSHCYLFLKLFQTVRYDVMCLSPPHIFNESIQLFFTNIFCTRHTPFYTSSRYTCTVFLMHPSKVVEKM